MRWVFVLLVVFATVPGRAGDRLDVRDWLARPGVKLVVVEFYATWCKPCMAAIPRWKALHDKYRDQGLRLVVVNTQDPGGQCGAPGWTPDDMVCDLSGAVAGSLGAKKLPAAYLWSWQGKLLSSAGHVEDVERAVESYLKSAPRVAVEALNVAGKPDAALAALVRAELTRSDKLQVVASEAELKKLRALRKASHGARKSDTQRCKLGAEVSANSLLTARTMGKGRSARLALSLTSVETGCQLALTHVPMNLKKPAASVDEAITALHSQLRGRVQLPGAGAARVTGPAPVVDEKLGGAPADTWDPGAGAARHVVQFKSTPPGAVVMVDGKLVCTATPCSGEVTEGRHTVELQKQQYQARRESVEVAAGTLVDWTLTADFALVTVTTTPPGVPVTVDGKAAGQTPLTAHRLSPGVHEVLVGGRCHHPTGQRLTFKRGDNRTLTLTPTERPSALDVSAKDDKGNALVAEVTVDGQVVGKTPGRFKVSVCAASVQVTHKTLGRWSQKLSLVEKQVTPLTAVLKSAPVVSAPTAAGGAKWAKIPAGTFTMGSNDGASSVEKPTHRVRITRAFFLQTTEVTQGQWKALMGTSPSGFSSCGEDCPVEQVSWWDAAAYCNALSKRERLPACYTLSGCSGKPGDGSYKCSSATSVGPSCRGYRLPTEAEWEYAVRAGTTGPRYGEVNDIAWYDQNSGHKTHRVGQKTPNAWGLYDMLGNVYEWTGDWYAKYSSGSATDPTGPESADFRVARGGSWDDSAGYSRAASRYWYQPAWRRDYLGFRPARFAAP